MSFWRKEGLLPPVLRRLLAGALLTGLSFLDGLLIEHGAASESLRRSLIMGVPWTVSMLVIFGVYTWWKGRRRGTAQHLTS